MWFNHNIAILCIQFPLIALTLITDYPLNARGCISNFRKPSGLSPPRCSITPIAIGEEAALAGRNARVAQKPHQLVHPDFINPGLWRRNEA